MPVTLALVSGRGATQYLYEQDPRVNQYRRIHDSSEWGDRLAEVRLNIPTWMARAICREGKNSISAMTLRQVLDMFTGRYGDEFLQRFVVVYNGINLRFADISETELRDGDEISVFSVGGGG